MESTSAGELVKVTGERGPALDGIVFDTPSRTKVVVAVLEAGRGPVMRTVHPDALGERAEAGPHDHALRLLVRRTPAPVRGGARGGSGPGRGSAGHSRGAAHRTTGR
ncbi:MAG TPA: hypothetical protein VGF63_00070 [Solirubrobacteraceae bacterium]|jgi:hypothetical protein